MVKELSEEEVYANDIDPLQAIADIRRAEGVPEEELSEIVAEADSDEVPAVEEDTEELDNLQEDTTAETGEKDEIVETDETDDVSDPEKDPDLDEESEESDKGTAEKESEAEVKHKFTANGQEFEFTDAEMKEQFGVVFGQAMDYTKKTQKMAPYRKMISALEEENITAEQLNVAIDALKGNPQALKTMMEANKLEPFDITNSEDENSPYSPTSYGKNDTQLGIKDVTDVISQDQEYKITVDVIDHQWDDNSRDVLASNPGMIQGLHNDIKSGVYDKVAPAAMKMKVLDGNTKSDLEYYMLAGEEVFAAEKQNSADAEKSVAELNGKAQDAEDEFDQASSEAQRKRSASPTRKRADTKGVIDYLDDDDEAYEAWYKKLQASN